MQNSLILLAASANLSLWEKLAVWYEHSLISELIASIGERYFSVQFGNYEHLSVSSGAGMTVRSIIFALTVGVVLAAILTAYNRVTLGGFVRKLIAEDCLSPESAKTLADLGYFRSPAIRSALARGSSLRMVVRCRESETGEGSVVSPAKKPARMDFLTAQFYIPEDLRARAEVRFDRKGSDWRPVILVCILIVVVAALLCRFLPDVFQFADNLITVLSPK